MWASEYNLFRGMVLNSLQITYGLHHGAIYAELPMENC